MGVDVTELRSFYESELGDMARRQIARAIARFWPTQGSSSLVGLGFATPFLPVGGSDGAPRTVLAFMPAGQGTIVWPPAGPTGASLVDPLMLPLPDGCVERVLVVHALELAASPDELLYEVSRVLAPGGRAILVCPNRRGLWARLDTTPFGHGQPFSRSQLRRLLSGAMLSPHGWVETLYAPPFASRLLLRTHAAWERVGSGLSLPLAGLHVVEASRQAHRLLPVGRLAGRTRQRPVLVPAAASRTAAPSRQ